MRSFRIALTIGLAILMGAASCSSPNGKPALEKTGSRGLSQNGLSQNGLSQNGLSQNGLSQNGLSQNGLSQNGLSQNGLSQNGLSQNGLSTIDILKGDQNARDLFKYIYSCAMPAGQSITLNLGGSVGD